MLAAALVSLSQLWLLSLPCATAAPSPGERPRLIVETDAGGDPDDEQSLVRFLLYTNEWDVEGIIANRARAREGENLNKERTGLGILRRFLDAYDACQPRLAEHDPRFPAADQLRARTVAGYAGDDGVDLIIRIVDADDPRPVWFLNWGTDHGSAESSLKLALDRILRDRGPEGYASFKQRLRLASADKFGDHTWKISPPFPLWVDTFRPEVDGRRWYHRFSALTATAGGFDLRRDLVEGHGPLGLLYPANTTHPQKEGDSMTFLYLVPTGMNDPEHPGWGSWAGRYGHQADADGREYYWADQPDEWSGTIHRDNALARFAADLQNDLAARLDWCVKLYDEANHPPAVHVAGAWERDAKAGTAVALDARDTADPDGDKLNYRWQVYWGPGTYRGSAEINDAESPVAAIVAPAVMEPQTIHVLLTVTDDGEPPLARYSRVVVTVTPP